MEFLKKLFDGKALTYEELEAAVNGAGIKLADISSGYAGQGDLEAKERELKAANESIRELTGKLKGFDGVDVEGLKADVKSWETKYNNDMRALKKAAAVDMAVMKAGARNAKAVKALIDMDKVTVKDDGTIEGLDIEKIKETDGYLFNVETVTTEGNGVAAGRAADGAENLNDVIAKAMGII